MFPFSHGPSASPLSLRRTQTAAASNNCFLLLGPSQKRSYLKKKKKETYATCQLEIIVPYSHTPLKEKHNHMSRFDHKYSRTAGSVFNTVIISVSSSFLAFKVARALAAYRRGSRIAAVARLRFLSIRRIVDFARFMSRPPNSLAFLRLAHGIADYPCAL